MNPQFHLRQQRPACAADIHNLVNAEPGAAAARAARGAASSAVGAQWSRRRSLGEDMSDDEEDQKQQQPQPTVGRAASGGLPPLPFSGGGLPPLPPRSAPPPLVPKHKSWQPQQQQHHHHHHQQQPQPLRREDSELAFFQASPCAQRRVSAPSVSPSPVVSAAAAAAVAAAAAATHAHAGPPALGRRASAPAVPRLGPSHTISKRRTAALQTAKQSQLVQSALEEAKVNKQLKKMEEELASALHVSPLFSSRRRPSPGPPPFPDSSPHSSRLASPAGLVRQSSNYSTHSNHPLRMGSWASDASPGIRRTGVRGHDAPSPAGMLKHSSLWSDMSSPAGFLKHPSSGSEAPSPAGFGGKRHSSLWSDMSSPAGVLKHPSAGSEAARSPVGVGGARRHPSSGGGGGSGSEASPSRSRVGSVPPRPDPALAGATDPRVVMRNHDNLANCNKVLLTKLEASYEQLISVKRQPEPLKARLSALKEEGDRLRRTLLALQDEANVLAARLQ